MRRENSRLSCRFHRVVVNECTTPVCTSTLICSLIQSRLLPCRSIREVVPGAALMRAEPSAVHRDSHVFPAEEPDDQVHHLPDVFDGEPGHPTTDDTVPGEHQATEGEALTVFHVSFDAVIGLV